MKPRFFALNLFAAAVLLTALWIAAFLMPEASRENGLMENLQALFLAGAFLVAASYPWRRRQDGWLDLLLATTLLTMFLREVDVDRFDLPAWLISMSSGTGRGVLLGLLWLATLVIAWKNRTRLLPLARQGFASPWGWTLMIGGALYLLGAFFDKKIVPIPKPQRVLWEEALETAAACWIAIGVLRWILRKKNEAPDHAIRRRSQDPR